eukprot:snap_masked-scaffold_51-processed-gene-1.34-mRNA-1 protein AED:1.00 eAED:1.00 QI:0/0/0/0/1/1/2/0/292
MREVRVHVNFKEMNTTVDLYPQSSLYAVNNSKKPELPIFFSFCQIDELVSNVLKLIEKYPSKKLSISYYFETLDKKKIRKYFNNLLYKLFEKITDIPQVNMICKNDIIVRGVSEIFLDALKPQTSLTKFYTPMSLAKTLKKEIGFFLRETKSNFRFIQIYSGYTCLYSGKVISTLSSFSSLTALSLENVLYRNDASIFLLSELLVGNNSLSKLSFEGIGFSQAASLSRIFTQLLALEENLDPGPILNAFSAATDENVLLKQKADRFVSTAPNKWKVVDRGRNTIYKKEEKQR